MVNRMWEAPRIRFAQWLPTERSSTRFWPFSINLNHEAFIGKCNILFTTSHREKPRRKHCSSHQETTFCQPYQTILNIIKPYFNWDSIGCFLSSPPIASKRYTYIYRGTLMSLGQQIRQPPQPQQMPRVPRPPRPLQLPRQDPHPRPLPLQGVQEQSRAS